MIFTDIELLSVRANGSYTTVLINMPETALCDWRFPTNEQALEFHQAYLLVYNVKHILRESLATFDKDIL